jgi:DNA-binding LacI/PurR family transcriptional regulator
MAHINVHALPTRHRTHHSHTTNNNLSSALPLYEAIKRDLKSRIESGELPEGTRILPEIELAKQIGVSRSTARKALQALEMEGLISRTAGRGSFVKAQPRDRVGQRSLGRGTLAISAFDCGRYSHGGRMLHGFMDEALDHGYQAIVHPPQAPDMDEFEHLLRVRQSGAQGWAVWLRQDSEKNLSVLRNHLEEGGALVMLERGARNLDCDAVLSDNEGLGYTLTQSLLEKGHKQIGVISAPLDGGVTQDRLAGYRRALEEADLPFDDSLVVVDGGAGREALRLQMLALLGRRERPTALLCTSENLGRIVMSELEALSYRTPEDIEVALVDAGEHAGDHQAHAIRARQRSYEMGQEAARLLIQRLEHKNLPTERRWVAFERD